MTARRIELAAAVACLALTVAGATYALFAPTIRVSTQSAVIAEPVGDPTPPATPAMTNEQRSMFEDGVERAAAAYLSVIAALAVGVAALAIAHGRSPATRGAAPLWAAAAAITFLAVIAGFSIGLFFLPAALAAIVAAAAASRYATQLRAHPA